MIVCMKFATAREHRDFFRKHQIVEFEELLSPEQLHQLLSAVKEILSSRLKLHVNDLLKHTPDLIFNAGRDLWRASAAIKRFVTNPKYAGIASELVNVRSIRIGYDQVIPSGVLTKQLGRHESNAVAYAKAAQSLEEVSSLQGVVCGFMLCLESGESEPNSSITELFSNRPGSAVFFHPKVPIPFPQLLQKRDSLYFMVVYTQPTAVYIHNNNDPLGHLLKNVGYSYGDKLVDKSNPILN